MRRILIPVDFSGNTDIACTYALELSRTEPAELRLFHTYFDQIILADSSFPDAIDMSTMYNEELLKEISHNAERNMSELKEKLDQEITRKGIQGVSVTYSLVVGEIEHEMKELYNEFKADLIVIGTTGIGTSLNIWGKVSSFLIKHSDIPVMAIPEIPKFLGFKKIMMAVDLGSENADSIKGVLNFFRPFSSTIFCVHFLSKSGEKDELDKMNTLKQQFKAEEKSGLISFEMREIEDDNQKTIDLFVKEFGIGMIVFQPHKHGIFYKLFTKNITRKNLFATNIPLLTIPVNPPK